MYIPLSSSYPTLLRASRPEEPGCWCVQGCYCTQISIYIPVKDICSLQRQKESKASKVEVALGIKLFGLVVCFIAIIVMLTLLSIGVGGIDALKTVDGIYLKVLVTFLPFKQCLLPMNKMKMNLSCYIVSKPSIFPL